jgi:hypothetical protein
MQIKSKQKGGRYEKSIDILGRLGWTPAGACFREISGSA